MWKSVVLQGFFLFICLTLSRLCRAQGRSAKEAYDLIEDGLALQDAGVFSLVCECVPASVAKELTNALDIPVIGIGSGPHTNGQVLVYHDMLGMMQHPHHAAFTPQFCKQYASVGNEIQRGLAEFKQDVESGAFPSNQFSPYKIADEELELLHSMLKEKAESGTPQSRPSKGAAAEEEPTIKVY